MSDKSGKATMRTNKAQIDMTQGSIARQLIVYAVPLLLGDMLQQLYNTADSMIVGNLISRQALAAVGATSNIVNVLVGMFTGISTGATVVISRYFGARQSEKLPAAVRTTLCLTAALGVLFTVLGVAGTPMMLRLLKAPADVYPVAKTYLRIYFMGISGLILYNMCAGILRAIGDSRRPMYVLIFCSVTNIGLDLLLIAGFSMQVEGAAIATIVSQFLSAGILLYILWHTQSLGALREGARVDREMLREMIRIGLPMGIQKSVVSFSNRIVVSYINLFESGAMAAWSIYLRLDQIILHTYQSMSAATTTFVAQNSGAQKYGRIKQGIRTALLLTMLTVCAYAVTFAVLRYPLVRLFNQDAEVLYYGSTVIGLLPPFQILNTISQIEAGALRGKGDSKTPMLIMLVSYVAARQAYLHIGWRYFRTFAFVVMSYPFSWIVCALLMLGYVWLQKRRVARSARPRRKL